MFKAVYLLLLLLYEITSSVYVKRMKHIDVN